MPIPVFVSQIIASATDTIRSGGGTTIPLPATQYYFYISSKATTGNGKSLLQQLKDTLEASAGGVTWTCLLNADLKLKITHNSGSTQNVILGRGFAWNLGFQMVFGTTWPVDPTLTITIPVPAGAGGYVAEFRSPYLWCPEMIVSSVGPELFDPQISPGIYTSAGAATRAPDMTSSYVTNGVQFAATYMFNGVQYLYRARASDPNFTSLYPHEREDFETWWRMGPRNGLRFLFYRSKDFITAGLAVSTAGTVGPPYVEYAPDEAMRNAPAMKPSNSPNLYYWDISVSCWGTEHGATNYLF